MLREDPADEGDIVCDARASLKRPNGKGEIPHWSGHEPLPARTVVVLIAFDLHARCGQLELGGRCDAHVVKGDIGIGRIPAVGGIIDLPGAVDEARYERVERWGDEDAFSDPQALWIPAADRPPGLNAERQAHADACARSERRGKIETQNQAVVIE